MKNKLKKINILGLVGFLLVVTGLSAITYDILTNYFEQKRIESDRQDFLDSINNGEGEDDPENNPSENSFDTVQGILKIEKIGVDNPVSISGDFDLLYRYLVAYKDSAIPPDEGNFTITGHNGNCANCGFRNLYRLVDGDVIVFTDKTRKTYKYEVYDNFIVDKSDIYVLDDIKDETTLTLITCQYPSLTRPERLIIRARLVEVTEGS